MPSMTSNAFSGQVGEHLLSLLQNLEPFANSDAFQDAAEATDDLHLLPEASRRCDCECGRAESRFDADLS